MKESYFFSSEKQFSSGQSIWIEFSQEKYNKDNILLKQDCHYHSEGKWKPLNLELGEKTLYLRSNCGHSGYLSLNFTTMIMSQFEEQDVIYFHKNNNILEIKGDDLQNLKGLLTQKCIQKTFHEDFHIEKIIADGTKKAMVFQAIRKSNKERVAVKAYNKKFINQFPKGRQILKNEIKALRMLNSENVIVLQEVHETVNSIYLIMDLIEGGQLSQRMPLFPDKNVRQLMYNFISTLNQIHNKKLILRNISPENILFKSYASHEDLVLIDFGEVQWKKSAYLPFRTGGFMAPEIFENKIVDGRCDIYSAGVIFYMLVVQNEQDPKKTNRIYCDLEARKFKQTPKDLQSLIKRMLREDPKHRYSAEKCLHHRYFQTIVKPTDIQEKSQIHEIHSVKVIGNNNESDNQLEQQQSYSGSSVQSQSSESIKKDGKRLHFSKFRKFCTEMEEFKINSPLSMKKDGEESLFKIAIKNSLVKQESSTNDNYEGAKQKIAIKKSNSSNV